MSAIDRESLLLELRRAGYDDLVWLTVHHDDLEHDGEHTALWRVQFIWKQLREMTGVSEAERHRFGIRVLDPERPGSDWVFAVGYLERPVDCPDCHGSGFEGDTYRAAEWDANDPTRETDSTPCSTCKGTGRWM